MGLPNPVPTTAPRWYEGRLCGFDLETTLRGRLAAAASCGGAPMTAPAISPAPDPEKCRDCGWVFTPEDGESLCPECRELDRELARDRRAWARGELWERDRLEDDL